MIGNTHEERAHIVGNPVYQMRNVEYLLDPTVIARNENFVAINGALRIDLSGQIGVHTIGPRVVAGVGGHLAFALGAYLCPSGRYICVMPSTGLGGTVSNIVPRFEEGQIVTVPREISDTVVTEFGIARLLGKTVRQRAEELISVAHPDFRAELRNAIKSFYYPSGYQPEARNDLAGNERGQMINPSLDRSEALWKRAQRVIPGGVYGHQNAGAHGERHPKFLARGEGSRVWDVDGNEYVDWMCAYGPMVLGYRNAVVDRAVAEQMELGDTLSLPGEAMVEYAEALVAKTAGMDWAIFGKNGADVTSWAIDTARAQTGKSKVVKVRNAYHGARPWTIPVLPGVPPHHRDELIEVVWNDVEGLRSMFAEEGDAIACVILTPYDHQLHHAELPSEGWYPAVRSLCDAHDAVFVMDDVRAGFRFDLAGSHVYFDAAPDLVCYSKAIANGYALSAGLGVEALRPAAERIFFTGSFFFQSSAFAAASATLAEMERTDAVVTIHRVGQLLIDGLEAQAESFGEPLVSTGPAAMPSFHFGDDPEYARFKRWCDAATEQGAYLHPGHNWFVSAAHTEEDVDRTLEATERAFEELRSSG